MKKLLETKNAFSASGLWNYFGTRIGNASVVLRAQKAQVDIEAAKNAAQARSQADRRSKVLINAQAALQKYQQNRSYCNDRQGLG